MSIFAAAAVSGATGGGGTGTPDTILGSDLLVWYKIGTGIYDSVVGGSLVTTNGQEIGRWEDASGNGYHATRSTAIGTGNLQWNTTNMHRGAGTVHFASTGNPYLVIPDAVGSALSTAGAGQIWMRFQKQSTAPCDTAGLCDFGTDTLGNHFLWSDCHWYDGFGSTARKECGLGSFDTGVFHTTTMWSATNDYGARIDNGSVLSFSTATNTVGFRTSNLRLGNSTGSYYMWGDFSEIVIAKAKASSTQNDNLHTYLST